MPRRTSNNPAGRRKRHDPLAANVDTQDRSPLYRLSIELRLMIFEFIFGDPEDRTDQFVAGVGELSLKDTPLEESAELQPSEDVPLWVRPGCTSRRASPMSLLLLCKRTYAEVETLAIKATVHTCYQGGGPGKEPLDYFARFTKKQLAHVSKVHLYTQPASLAETDKWVHDQFQRVAGHMQHLTMTLRAPTSQKKEPSMPLLINPFRLGPAVEVEKREDCADMMQDGLQLRIPTDGWAGAFASLSALKSLTMELEDYEWFEARLHDTAQWAQKWRFPAARKRQVLLCGTPPSKWTWRSLPVHDKYQCRSCRRVHPQSSGLTRDVCQHCEWRKRGRGPRMVVWRLQWAVETGDLYEDMTVEPEPERVTASRIPPRRIERPAYDPRLGGLNSIYAHASDQQLEELIRWGIL